MKTRTLLTKLGRLYPKRIALKHNDYVGYMAGQKVEEVKRIVLLLDLDEIVLEEALSHKPDLILTHHPFIRGTRAKVFARDEKKKAFALWLDTLPVTVYSMHTNFDEAPNGMNDALAEKLELSAVKPLASEPMARGGYLPYPMTVEEAANYIVDKLEATYGLLIAGDKEREIKRVAIIGGGGSRDWPAAMAEGYDMYISGDAPHYVRRDVMNAGYNYLDVPHEIENAFLWKMKEVLLTIDPSFEVIAIKHEKPPVVIK